MSSKPRFRNGLCAAATLTALTASGVVRADDSAAILKASTDYVAAQSSITATFDSDVEVVTPELQKIQFASSGDFRLSRPDKLRIHRTGGYTDAELIYDGKTLTIHGNNVKSYIQADEPGSIDHIVDVIQSHAVTLPGMDLLVSNAFDLLTSDVIEGKHIGPAIVDGVECEHLAFRGTDTDWQIWIEAGSNPIPRKYVITSKTLAGAPQYTLRVKSWNTDPISDANAFAFKPTAEMTKVSLAPESMSEFDEVPAGVSTGGHQ